MPLSGCVTEYLNRCTQSGISSADLWSFRICSGRGGGVRLRELESKPKAGGQVGLFGVGSARKGPQPARIQAPSLAGFSPGRRGRRRNSRDRSAFLLTCRGNELETYLFYIDFIRFLPKRAFDQPTSPDITKNSLHMSVCCGTFVGSVSKFPWEEFVRSRTGRHWPCFVEKFVSFPPRSQQRFLCC